MKNGLREIDSSVFDRKNPYEKYDRNLRLLKSYIETIPNIEVDDSSGNTYASLSNSLIREIDRKPSVCILGNFDSGKSTLANALLGNNIIPTNILPTTCLPTFIKHVDERPRWMQGDVIILRHGFNPRLWKDPAHTKNYIWMQGTLAILEEFVTHKKSKSKLEELVDLTAEQLIGKEKEHEFNKESEYAIVFLDSPVLRCCEIVDYPGFGNDDFDNEKAESYQNIMDGAFYLSTITGFLLSYEIRRLGQIIQSLDKFELIDPDFPTLGGLFVLATHADPDKYDENTLEEIAVKETKRIFKQLGETKIHERVALTNREITPYDVASKIHAFWYDSNLNKKNLGTSTKMFGSFMEDFAKFAMEHLPRFWEIRAEKLVADFALHEENALTIQIESYQNRLDEIKNLESIYAEYMNQEQERKSIKSLKHSLIREKIKDFKVQSLNEFESSYERILDEKKIEQVIKSKYENNKKEAQEYTMGYLLEKLEESVKNILIPKTEYIKQQTDDFISEYSNASKLSGESVQLGITIDGVGAFAAGLAKVTFLGAMAAWGAATGAAYLGAALALSGNATIAAIGSGLLAGSAVAASIGNGLAVAWTVATGPIGLGVIATVSLAAIAMKTFGPSWQLRLARKIRSEIDKNTIKEKFNDSMCAYWDSSLFAFNEGAKSIEEKWLKKLDELRRQVEQPEEEGKKEIEGILENLENMRSFFAKLYWDGA
ncbi:putative membrane protein [Rubidibacter lacunae KORDI 51-2]|uniref:Putative membrane protein n=1 Tax=Rubidibacter lacunae KORDI 51-2 TaxID=582515 RepID=U5DHM9_9CHRO|nr:dynamin family protein [Rubidibacter lacunae]ERN41131.1 putative membrane protein [Rubidibacter lacunae KORDI 51-2]